MATQPSARGRHVQHPVAAIGVEHDEGDATDHARDQVAATGAEHDKSSSSGKSTDCEALTTLHVMVSGATPCCCIVRSSSVVCSLALPLAAPARAAKVAASGTSPCRPTA